MDLPNKERLCHRTNFTLSCRDLVCAEKCKRWTMILGEDPQTGVAKQHWNCIDDHIPIILLSLGKSQEHMTASIDKAHNGAAQRHDDVQKSNKELAQSLAAASFALGASDAPLQIEERKN